MNITDSFPDISFIDNATVEDVLAQMVNDYQDKYRGLTGKEASLAQANPYRLIMYSCAMQIYQAMQYADYAGKMSFLKYARGDFLDNLAALRGVKRSQATYATTLLKFSVDAAIGSTIGIPAGTRVTNGNSIYFATDEYAEIAAGEVSVTVSATCTTVGAAGNGFEPGEFRTLVNTLPFISEVLNIEKTSGGAETEDDDNLKYRVYLANGKYSVAGPDDAYIYWTKSVSQTISDVVVTSPVPGEVDVCFVCENGELPSQALMDQVVSVLMNDDIRPLTDRVKVLAPVIAEYEIRMTYYIAESDRISAVTIQSEIEAAVSSYKMWQSEKIGRDINPSFLIKKVMEAGAKRVVVDAPVFTVISANAIAACTDVSITYGGLEDD